MQRPTCSAKRSCVAVTRPDGTLDFCNASLLQLTAQNAATLLGSSIFTLLDSANGELQSLHRTVLATNIEQRAQVRSSSGKFVAQAILGRLDRHDGHRVVWSSVEVGDGVPVPELALWGTEIGLWDWDVVNDRLTWINDWCEHSQVTVFSGSGHRQLWSAHIHPEDLSAYRPALSAHLGGQTPSYNVEYRLRNRGDAWVWIEEQGRVIGRDLSGQVRRVVGLCLDVNERHNTARALERSESTQKPFLEARPASQNGPHFAGHVYIRVGSESVEASRIAALLSVSALRQNDTICRISGLDPQKPLISARKVRDPLATTRTWTV